MLYDLFNEIQDVFGVKMLIDLMEAVFEIFVVISWICCCIAVPSLAHSFRTGRMIVIFVKALCHLGFLVHEPMQVSQLPHQLLVNWRKICFARQQCISQKRVGITCEEMDIAYSTEQLLRKEMTFMAGHMAYLDLSMIASVSNFCVLPAQTQPYHHIDNL
ncbi:uncharacterized protein LOC129588295 [Paramacrobiotus metropolitanus]|uniref:uncharacterized protein LOC129588295 n=1 Tax=Paramacrobiotus metropolitanus TaxID=2943436 RepID=UPI0024464131|nr:uncharacterized protein LOC129588295 [Paramacrobiotus metropolitanus]